MTELKSNSLVIQTIALLTCYGFDLRGYPALELIQQWLNHYQSLWIRLAVIEALYQGRYKAISVEQILNCWLRLGHPSYHFNHEFERLVCRKFPRYLISDSQNSVSKQDEEEWWEAVNQEIAEALDENESVVQLPDGLEKTTPEENHKPDSTFSHTRESGVGVSQSSIDQFTPSPDDSEFYGKLKAMTNLDLELAANLI